MYSFFRRSFFFTHSIEPNETQLNMLHFILAFTVCISTRLGVSPNTKGNKIYNNDINVEGFLRIQKVIKIYNNDINRRLNRYYQQYGISPQGNLT